ncbi:cytochrome b/b6 domain-containing protein [Thioclava sp. 'Guangxiensis']|uniref:cytochrome b/b6 domain-containing protein n=1 Tax=Thioclava sp. 'Guangxiensis' TaxID=3149044 RepID=UPI003877CB43
MTDQFAAAPEETVFETVPVWDPFVRAFHWALVVLVCGAWGLGKWGPADMSLHFLLGYFIGGLVVARVLWGFVGPRTARFASFVKGPGAIARYGRKLVSRKPSYTRGHNPLGGLSVVLILGLLAVQVGTGLVSDPEDYLNVGPFADWVGYDRAVQAVDLHETVANLLLILTLVHVGAILWYRLWKRENLVTPMITGRARLPVGPAAEPRK